MDDAKSGSNKCVGILQQKEKMESVSTQSQISRNSARVSYGYGELKYGGKSEHIIISGKHVLDRLDSAKNNTLT